MCTSLFKVTTFDDTTLSSSRQRYPTNNIIQHAYWISAYVKAHIKPSHILLIKVELEEEFTSNMI